ncbi:MAG: S49 family peptidase [Pseudomonadota bacterium]
MADEEKNWERETLEKLAFATLKEQRKARRWGIFFKLLTFAYVTFLLILLLQWRGDTDIISDGNHTALIELDGVIDAKGEASAEKITGALQRAFQDKYTRGVILRINSPGGSPVQSGIIYDEVRRLRGAYPNTPLYAVVEDICASGGYFVAASADKIYVNKASLVGSIGVLMDGFGFTGGMEKLGVERRLLTAGENKGFMDPFSPVDPKQKEYAVSMLGDIHKQFIGAVKQGRGKRLKDSPDLFSGLVWTGQKAVDLGLADGFGSVESVARDVIKAEQLVDYTEKSNPVERIAKRFGAAAARSFGEFALRERMRIR